LINACQYSFVGIVAGSGVHFYLLLGFGNFEHQTPEQKADEKGRNVGWPVHRRGQICCQLKKLKHQKNQQKEPDSHWLQYSANIHQVSRVGFV